MEKKIDAWLARDKDNRLYIFNEKPFKDGNFTGRGYYFWNTNNSTPCLLLNDNDFQNIRWEDKEPTKVELIIKICE